MRIISAAILACAATLPGLVEAKRLCLERLSGVCLRFKEVPDTVPVKPAGPKPGGAPGGRPTVGATASPALRAERSLSLTRADKLVVQGVLERMGLYSGGLDGVFGPGTRRAIRRWQETRRRRRTGYLSADDLRELRARDAAVRNARRGMSDAEIARYLKGKRFRCPNRPIANILIFDTRHFTGRRGVENYFGSWSVSGGVMTRDLFKGKFANGSSRHRIKIRIDRGDLIMGRQFRCRLTRRGVLN